MEHSLIVNCVDLILLKFPPYQHFSVSAFIPFSSPMGQACSSATVSETKYDSGDKPVIEESKSSLLDKTMRAQNAKQKVFDELSSQADIPEEVTKMFANVSMMSRE